MNKSLAFAWLLIASVTADAACQQGNIRGIWQDFALNSIGFVGHCTVIIAGNGAVSSGSVCFNYSGSEDIPPVHFTGGQFNLDASCGINATLTGDNGVVASINAQMDRKKNSFAGISRNNGGVVTLHHFVRQ